MSTKQAILEILEQNRNESISGQQLANQLSISRAAIWKAINALKNDGYCINAVTNKGYRLSDTTDLLSPEGIRPHLRTEYSGCSIIVHKQVDSTNNEAKKSAAAGAVHGTVILAEEQTAGRGRLGRNFFSPLGTGIYMSIILRPQLNVANAVLITTATAVAVCRAIEKFTSDNPMIKWVNDIYLSGRKICGILTEATTDFESGVVDNVIIGIGINYMTGMEQFPDSLRETAGSLFASPLPNLTRNLLVAEVINQLLDISSDLHNRAFLSEYRSRSMIIGENIVFYRQNSRFAATAVDIDLDGGLIVQMEDGNMQTLQSGEITIRRIENEN